ncbi:MAG: L-seryl-tRNA(Sec) selenium transferase [Actinomycetia bacterium]|nr:L-seryl-tRNA(Sec) selenium transferase [Actinomycetes bacterium]
MVESDPRRLTPRVDSVLMNPRVAQLTSILGDRFVRHVVLDVLEVCRRGELDPDQVVDEVVFRLPTAPTGLKRVINATGILIHTNLGRAPLSQAAIDAVALASSTTDLEFDLATGMRASRGTSALDALSRAVPPAEAVHVVNNGAAALTLVAAGLARGREVVVARGELIEIGDSFRIKSMLEAAGTQVREVGAANRVHLRDYQEALNQRTGLVLKVHPSNFATTGFTKSVSTRELTTLDVPVVVDIGSGLLNPHPLLPNEPDATSTLGEGADVVLASGDKLLGGPQCGLVLGRRVLIDRLRRDPLARALRVGKMTLAALEATIDGPPSPVATALRLTQAEVLERAHAIVGQLSHDIDSGVIDTVARIGGGGAPEVSLKSAAVRLSEPMAAPLRTGRPTPVVGYLRQGHLLLDLLTVAPQDDEEVLKSILGAHRQLSNR